MYIFSILKLTIYIFYTNIKSIMDSLTLAQKYATNQLNIPIWLKNSDLHDMSREDLQMDLLAQYRMMESASMMTRLPDKGQKIRHRAECIAKLLKHKKFQNY